MKNGWPLVELKDVMQALYDGPHATPKVSEDGAIFLGIKNVTEDGRLDLSEVRYIAEDDLPKWTKRVTPQKDDIVFSYEATLHRYARIPQNFRGCLGRRMALIRPNKQVADIRYLFHYFLSPLWRNEVERYILTGATVDRIPLTNVPKFKLHLPPLPIQQKIAGILSAYDDLIENNLKRIKLLEEMAQITYEEWFVRLRFPGHESTPINPETNLPEGWKQKQLADYFPIKTGKKDANIQTADGQYPFFTCSQGTYRTDVYSFDAEAIILAGNGEFNIKYYRGKFEAYQRNYVLIPNDSGFLFLLFLFMKHYLYQITAGSKGAVIKYLTKDMIANTKFHEPTISVLAAFNDIVVPVFYEIENLEKQNQRLREARDILLPRLMTGMIDVESYDPAQLLKEAV